MKKYSILLILLFFILKSNAQNINAYKYIVIPEAYQFAGEIDEYRLNSLTKFLFKKEGFLTVMKGEEKPEELRANPCMGLTVDVKDNSGVFVTKLVIQLRNCSGELVFESEEGRSRTKKYIDAYQEAFREAFESVKQLDYQYDPLLNSSLNTKKQGVSPTLKVQVENPISISKRDSSTSDQSEEKELAEVQVSAIPAPAKYTSGGTEYYLEVNEKGFALYQKDGSEPIALLVSAGKPGTYIYNSLANQGIAYFENDRFIVEYYKTSTGETIKKEYLKKD